MGSLMKKTGRLLNTKSWFPSSVKSFMDQPRISRTVSAAPLSPAVVEIRPRRGVFFPLPLRNLASVISERSSVTSNSPHAPAAFAWTTRSGMRSRGKCARVSINWVSARIPRPPPPYVVRTCREAEGSETGAPVISVSLTLIYLVTLQSLPSCKV
jgi:hypothetical protein